MIPLIKFNSQQSNVASPFNSGLKNKNRLPCDFSFPEVVSFYTEIRNLKHQSRKRSTIFLILFDVIFHDELKFH